MPSIDDVSAKITADSSGYTAAMAEAGEATKKATKSMSNDFEVVGNLLNLYVVDKILEFGRSAVEEFNKATHSSALLKEEIRASGDASGYTAGQLERMAENLNVISGLGSIDILSGVINSLSKFRYISGVTFSDAAKDAVGWASTGTASLSEAGEKIGRALENPTMAFRLLRGSMADLSPEQQKQITQLMAQGKIQDAQNIIIGNLNKGYGDMAKRMAELPSAKIAADMKTIQENMAPMGGIIEKALIPLFDFAENISNAFAHATPATKEFIVVVGSVLVAVGPMLTALGFISSTLLPAMAAGWGLVTGAVAGFNAVMVFALETLLPIVAGILAVVAVGKILYDNWNSLKSEGSAIWAGIKGYVLEAIAGILTAVSKIPGMGRMFSSTIRQMKADAAADMGSMQKNMADSMNTTVDFGTSMADLGNTAKTAFLKVEHAARSMFEKHKTGLKDVGKANKEGTADLIPPWITALGNIKTLGQVTFEAIGTAAQSMASGITDALTTGGTDWRTLLGNTLQAMLKTIVDWAIQNLMAIEEVAQAFDFLSENPLLAVGLIVGLMAAVSALHVAPPKMAAGGMFDRATNVTVGEAGPEVILPVTRLSNGKMGVETAGGGFAGGSSPQAGGFSPQASAGQDIHLQVMLDSNPIIKMVAKASRTGKLIIHPNSVRISAVNS